MAESHGHHPKKSTRPWKRLTDALRFERSDIWTVIAFAVAVGVLSIATPAAIEALVNTVAFGVQLWPVVVLAGVMFAFLTLSAVLKAIQLYVVECIQRRLFVRTADAFADHFASAEIESFDGRNPKEQHRRELREVRRRRLARRVGEVPAHIPLRPGRRVGPPAGG